MSSQRNDYSLGYVTNVRDNQITKPILDNTTRMIQLWLKNTQRSVTHIPIKIRSSETPVTVQALNEGELDWCNHAGWKYDVIPSDVTDNPNMVVAEACDKCNSIRNIVGNWS